jgi:hypothetical protein
MIELLDQTITQLLRAELDVEEQGIEVSFSQPNGEWAARRSGPALSFFLYDVRENPTLRRHQVQQEAEHRSRPTRPGAATFRRTPLMLDCFYMVTAWSSAVDASQARDEHGLLSNVLQVLARYPVLNPRCEEMPVGAVVPTARQGDANQGETVLTERRTAGHMVAWEELQRRAWLCNPDLNPLANAGNDDVEIRTRLAQHDVLTNPAEVWSALEAQMKAGFSYVVTLPLDPWRPLEAYRVKRQDLYIGQAERDPRTGALQRIDRAQADLLLSIGGVIHRQHSDGSVGAQQEELRLQLLHGPADAHADPTRALAPDQDAPHRYIADIAAPLATPVATAVSDREGRYQFADLPPGQYTLLIRRLDSGEFTMREFTLSPAGPTGFDFTI